MTTPDSWKIHRMYLTFSVNQTISQRNALLCSFANILAVTDSSQYQYLINRES